jgi:hypothetical protein
LRSRINSTLSLMAAGSLAVVVHNSGFGRRK